MKTISEDWIGPYNCRVKWKGRNLAEYRRVELRVIAREKGYRDLLDASLSKQDLLRKLVERL